MTKIKEEIFEVGDGKATHTRKSPIEPSADFSAVQHRKDKWI